MQEVKLPTWDECDIVLRSKQRPMTALEEFIWDWDDADPKNSAGFMQGLAAVIKEVKESNATN